MVEYDKDDVYKIARMTSFVENMCIAMNIINDSIAAHGDYIVKKDVAKIHRAHEMLREAVGSISEQMKKDTDGEIDMSIDSW